MRHRIPSISYMAFFTSDVKNMMLKLLLGLVRSGRLRGYPNRKREVGKVPYSEL